MFSLQPFTKLSSAHWVRAELSFFAKDQIEVQFTWPKEWDFVLSQTLSTQVAERRNELWKTTCFEAFFKDPHSSKYWELNMSPKGDWNIYAFTDYREPQPPQADYTAKLTRFNFGLGKLTAQLILPQINSNFLISLNCIIEELNGSKAYWALAHQTDKPDFHHFANFRTKGVTT